MSALLPQSSGPIVIIGGGPTGLFLSILLSRYNVPSVLLERLGVSDRFRHPQAHFLNTRTMEIFRHTVPDVYQQVRDAMPPVDQWKNFRFGANMKDTDSVVVEHPVDRPLQTGLDANGVLVGEREKECKKSLDLSPTNVGHLAQHTLGKLLYETALQEQHTSICFNTNVQSVSQTRAGMKIETEDGTVYETDLCVGSDGAHSLVRRTLGIPMVGEEAIQHLINVHVRLPPTLAKSIHENKNHAMLYSVFTSEAIAMVVCHNVGEYIIQIPYFPPFQTLDGDFGGGRIEAILNVIFGEKIESSNILSVKPWTMGSLVASRFVDRNAVLVGDAAHIFPPAGGLGMNTGLQDVHNLAWKIAHGMTDFTSYEEERRPIAQRNAALSVRNYKRLLQVTESAYLDKRHPEMLKAILENSPLPMSVQRTTFRALLRTALYPFSWLGQPGSQFGRHIRSNLQRVLRSGSGLPLLFPKHEIGFCYGAHREEQHQHWSQDTIAAAQEVRVGGLVPHALADVVSGDDTFTSFQYVQKGSKTISSVDLPAQMAEPNKCPHFVILFNKLASLVAGRALFESLQEKLSFPLQVALLDSDAKLPTDTIIGSSDAVLRLRSIEKRTFLENPCAILIRPDGHVAGIWPEGDYENPDTTSSRYGLITKQS